MLILALTNAAESRKLKKTKISRREGEGQPDIRLGTDFERDTRGCRLGVVNSLGASLDVRTNAVVIARGEGVEVVETVKGDGVFGGIVTDGRGVASNLTLGDVVSSLGTKKETITTKDGVCSESRTLEKR